jgi:hypothetical protein
MSKTQNAGILEYLRTGRSITWLECLQNGWGNNLSGRICDIKRANPGIDIRDEFVHQGGKSFKKYWIHKPRFEADLILLEDAVKQHEWAKK